MANGLRIRDPQPITLRRLQVRLLRGSMGNKEMTNTKRCFDSSHHSVGFLPFDIIASNLLPHQLSEIACDRIQLP